MGRISTTSLMGERKMSSPFKWERVYDPSEKAAWHSAVSTVQDDSWKDQWGLLEKSQPAEKQARLPKPSNPMAMNLLKFLLLRPSAEDLGNRAKLLRVHAAEGTLIGGARLDPEVVEDSIAEAQAEMGRRASGMAFM